jgi:hypothetical protein
VQRLQPARLYGLPALLARAVQSLVEALKCLIHRSQLILGCIVYDLQRLIVLDLNGAIAPVADQGVVASLQIELHASMALSKSIATGNEDLLDCREIRVWNRHERSSPLGNRGV